MQNCVQHQLDCLSQNNIKLKYNVNQYMDGQTLHLFYKIAIICDNQEMLEKLINQKNYINDQINGNSVFHLITEHNSIKCLSVVMKHNPNFFVTNKQNQNILHIAAMYNRNSIYKQISTLKPELENQIDLCGFTPTQYKQLFDISQLQCIDKSFMDYDTLLESIRKKQNTNGIKEITLKYQQIPALNNYQTSNQLQQHIEQQNNHGTQNFENQNCESNVKTNKNKFNYDVDLHTYEFTTNPQLRQLLLFIQQLQQSIQQFKSKMNTLKIENNGYKQTIQRYNKQIDNQKQYISTSIQNQNNKGIFLKYNGPIFEILNLDDAQYDYNTNQDNLELIDVNKHIKIEEIIVNKIKELQNQQELAAQCNIELTKKQQECDLLKQLVQQEKEYSKQQEIQQKELEERILKMEQLMLTQQKEIEQNLFNAQQNVLPIISASFDIERTNKPQTINDPMSKELSLLSISDSEKQVDAASDQNNILNNKTDNKSTVLQNDFSQQVSQLQQVDKQMQTMQIPKNIPSKQSITKKQLVYCKQSNTKFQQQQKVVKSLQLLTILSIVICLWLGFTLNKFC